MAYTATIKIAPSECAFRIPFQFLLKERLCLSDSAYTLSQTQRPVLLRQQILSVWELLVVFG